MIIRSATLHDTGRCSELLELLFDKESEFNPDPVRQEKGLSMIIENPSSGTVLVCEESENGCIAGMVILMYTISTALGRKVALLEDLIVDPAYQSRGVGTMLLGHAFELAAEKSLGRITLLTDLDNTAAHRLYEKSGFSRSGMVVFRKIISPGE